MPYATKTATAVPQTKNTLAHKNVSVDSQQSAAQEMGTRRTSSRPALRYRDKKPCFGYQKVDGVTRHCETLRKLHVSFREGVSYEGIGIAENLNAVLQNCCTWASWSGIGLKLMLWHFAVAF